MHWVLTLPLECGRSPFRRIFSISNILQADPVLADSHESRADSQCQHRPVAIAKGYLCHREFGMGRGRLVAISPTGIVIECWFQSQFYCNNRSKVPHLTGSVQQYRQTMREAKMRAQQHESPIVEGLKVYDLTTDSPSSLKLRIYKPLSPGANGAVMI